MASTLVADGTNPSQVVIPLSTTGDWTIPVPKNKKVTIGVQNAGASTFNVVGYFYSEADAAALGITRIMHKFAENITAAEFNIGSSVSMGVEVGIDVTVASAQPLTFEVIYQNQ